jgi:hypothetical protein
MHESRFTDFNILAREDGSTSYVVVGLQRIFQYIQSAEEFGQRLESLDHVANLIMETVENKRIPKLHSTLLAYTKTGGEEHEEVLEHLPARLRSYTGDRLPGSNVTTIEEGGKLIGYRTINQELPYLLSVLNQALAARRSGQTYDAVQQRSMREVEPPISY